MPNSVPTPTVRTPDQCPWRRLEPRGQIACGWLESALASAPRGSFGADGSPFVVSDDVCSACCRSFEPSAVDWNPVAAALVWQRATTALDSVGLSTAEREICSALAERAESFLPLVASDEEDLPEPFRVEEMTTGCNPNGGRWTVEQIAARLPAAQFGGRAIERWAVGVTTAPRRVPTLAGALDTLAATGLPTPRLFIDGNSDGNSDGNQVEPLSGRDLPRTIRQPAVGAWRNYYLTLAELLCTAPDAEGLLVVQDDALWPAGAPMADYLATCRWPTSESFIASFYCCADYTADVAGWRLFQGAWVYGAVAFGFSRADAEALVSDPAALQRCREPRSGGIDAWIGEWAVQRRIPVLVPTPSIVQHAGDVSTLWETSRAVGVRRAARWLRDELLQESPRVDLNSTGSGPLR